MRLIDADNFKEYYKEQFDNAKKNIENKHRLEQLEDMLFCLYEDIDNQPTVYKIDKGGVLIG